MKDERYKVVIFHSRKELSSNVPRFAKLGYGLNAFHIDRGVGRWDTGYICIFEKVSWFKRLFRL